MRSTPEIESLLAELTDVCCEALSTGGHLDHSRVRDLVASLAVNGWERHSEGDAPLSTVLSDRVKAECAEPAMHRGAALRGIVDSIEDAYTSASRMVSSTPSDSNHSQAMPPRSTA